MQNPRQWHWEAALQIVRCLMSYPSQGIFLSSTNDLRLTAYCDADQASYHLTYRSATRYFVFLGNSPSSWKTKKQPTVSRSSTKTEYWFIVVMCCSWNGSGSFCPISACISHNFSIALYYDSQATIHITVNPVYHERPKHIKIDCHLVREEYLVTWISLAYIPSQSQLADIFIKTLDHCQFHDLLCKLGICNLYTPAWRGVLENFLVWISSYLVYLELWL